MSEYELYGFGESGNSCKAALMLAPPGWKKPCDLLSRALKARG